MIESDQDAANERDEREDILSILREHRPYYFWALVTQILASGAAITWWEVVWGGHANALGCGIAVALKMSALIPLWLVTTILIVDAGRRIVVLLPDGRKKLRAKAKAEGRSEGRSEGLAEGVAIGRAEGVEEGVAIGRAEGMAEGRADGVSLGTRRTNSAWRQWNTRRLEFEARGEPFDEPPPDDDSFDDELNGKD